MQIKALSPLLALSCLSGMALAFGCSDPPAAETPGASGSSSMAGTTSNTSGTGTTAGSPGGGSASVAGSSGSATMGGNTTGGTPAAGGSAGTPAAGGTAGTGAGDPAPVIPGYTNVINENFDTPINLDTDPVWTWSDGGLDEGQVRFTKESITFEGGKMKITTSKPAGGVPASPSFAENTGGVNLKAFPLASGEFRTKHNNYRYGRYEARMKAPTPAPGNPAAGNFINTLFIFRTPKIEDWRELDIEVIGGGAGQLMTNIVHGNGVSAYGDTQNKAIQTPPAGNLVVPQGFETMSAFHDYAFEWDSTGVKWFVDGQQVRMEAAGGTPPIPDKPAKIMMSMWVFNASYDFGGLDGEANVYPFTAEYEYFRFYKKDGETFPCNPTPTCIAAEDKNKSKNNLTEQDTEG